MRAAARPTDVILTDLSIPGTAVEELFQHVKSTPGWGHIAFVLMTAMPAHYAPRSVSFDGIVRKPFSLAELVDMIHAALRGARARRGDR